MKTQLIAQTEIHSSRLAYGCMRIPQTWEPSEVTPEREAAARESLLTAYEAGYTLIDHADIYAKGASEEIHGRLMADVPSMREEIIIATKCGIKPPGQYGENSPHMFDFSAEHIKWSCEQSLLRLQTDYVDIYQLHRPDYLMDPSEVAEAFSKLLAQGKVKHFGVSNFLPDKVALLQEYCPFPLVVNQVEISLGHLDCLEDGTLNQCIQDEITPLSWSPLAGGWLGTGSVEGREGLISLLDELAAGYGVTRTEVSLAWLLKHPAGIIPIVGSTKPERITQAVKSMDVDMSRADWYRLLVAARGEPLP
jgi:predicted oxidoreductase